MEQDVCVVLLETTRPRITPQTPHPPAKIRKFETLVRL